MNTINLSNSVCRATYCSFSTKRGLGLHLLFDTDREIFLCSYGMRFCDKMFKYTHFKSDFEEYLVLCKLIDSTPRLKECLERSCKGHVPR